jgi:hypothetical protein
MTISFSLPLGAAIAFVVFAVGMACYVWVPRLAMAIALCWPLPMIYLARLFFIGSFERSTPLMIGLAVVGVIFGALAPRASRVLLSAALGSLFLIIALPFDASAALLFGPLAGGMVWQIAAWMRARRRRSTEPSMPLIPEPTKGEQWKVALAWCATVIVLVTLWSILAVQRVDARSISDTVRLNALAVRGELSRPGLLFSTLHNFYLSGKPLPVTLVTAEGAWWSRWTFPFTGRSLDRAVQRMRAVKDVRELKAMRRAATITSQAFADIEPLIRPGVNEAEIEARILRSFRENGATGVAFKSIVGSGPNAVLPHYEKNDAVMSEGLVVIDIGCEIDHYASDMTRTFPVSGTLSEAEAHLIEVVIEAGEAAREALKAGVTFGDVHDAAAKVIEDAGFGEFFTHRVGHHVGLNVHDPGHDPLEPGMVLTIEPGIYVPEGADTDPQYWNLGVRIEDTYIVTEDGWEQITSYPWCPGEEEHQPQAEVSEEEPP